MFKISLESENYTEILKNDDLPAYSNFRCNSLPLRALTGPLYEKIDYMQCKCQICNTGEVEDEYHFMMICPAYNTLRQQYLPSSICNAPTLNKFIVFMKLRSQFSIKCTVAYLKKALQERDKIKAGRGT